MESCDEQLVGKVEPKDLLSGPLRNQAGMIGWLLVLRIQTRRHSRSPPSVSSRMGLAATCLTSSMSFAKSQVSHTEGFSDAEQSWKGHVRRLDIISRGEDVPSAKEGTAR